MPDTTFNFPTNFRWGTATSAHQVEGNLTNNDWWAAEQAGGYVFQNQSSGAACDWWNRAEEDFDRMAAMGQNAHRLSVEWSRIQPRPDKWDESALARYREMIQGLIARGIEPMVTLHHFTNPIWLVERGGWENEDTIAWFEAYVRKVVGALGDLVDLWCTVNEPGVMIGQGYLLGRWPPGKRSLRAAMQVACNVICAHAAAFHAIHEINPSAQVGLAKHMVVWRPRRDWMPVDYVVSRTLNKAFNHVLLGAVSDGMLRMPGRRPQRMAGTARTLDWLGVNYYQRYRVGLKLRKAITGALHPWYGTRRGHQKGPGEWGEIHPRGLFQTLRSAMRYNVPLFITENGIPDEHDEHRPHFIVTHLHQLWQALQRQIPVQGYYHWSLVDNFEWTEGYDPRFRFGLFGVNFETQERFQRTSGLLYEEICKLGGISYELVERYAPEALPLLFPRRTATTQR